MASINSHGGDDATDKVWTVLSAKQTTAGGLLTTIGRVHDWAIVIIFSYYRALP